MLHVHMANTPMLQPGSESQQADRRVVRRRFGGSAGVAGEDRASRKLDMDSRGLPRRVSDDIWSAHTSRCAIIGKNCCRYAYGAPRGSNLINTS